MEANLDNVHLCSSMLICNSFSKRSDLLEPDDLRTSTACVLQTNGTELVLTFEDPSAGSVDEVLLDEADLKQTHAFNDISIHCFRGS